MPDTQRLYDVLYKREFHSSQPRVMFGGKKCLGYQADISGFAPYVAEDGSLANTGNVLLVSEETFTNSWYTGILDGVFFNDVFADWRSTPDGFDLRLVIPVMLPAQQNATFSGLRRLFVLDRDEVLAHTRNNTQYWMPGDVHELTRTFHRFTDIYTGEVSQHVLAPQRGGATLMHLPTISLLLRPSFIVPGDLKCFYDSQMGAWRLASTMMDVHLGTQGHGIKRAHELYLGTPHHGIKRAAEGYTRTASGLVRLF